MKEKTKSDSVYNQWWRNFDMNRTGNLFENCSDIIYRKYKVYINISEFIKYYLTSDLRSKLDKHYSNLSLKSNSEIIDLIIKNDFEGNIPKSMIVKANEKNNFAKNELYWMGWFFIYCLYSNKDIESSKELYSFLNFEKLYKLYPVFHEMSLGNCYNKLFNK